ncbi:MAG: hypothetical protein ACQUHE_12350 [Bacteroidia bacterium]
MIFLILMMIHFRHLLETKLKSSNIFGTVVMPKEKEHFLAGFTEELEQMLKTPGLSHDLRGRIRRVAEKVIVLAVLDWNE